MFMAGRAANLAMKVLALAVLAIAYAAVTTHAAEECGINADGALCPNRQCCSYWGYCGYTYNHCARGCQSQCDCHFSREHVGVGVGVGVGVASVVTRDRFDRMLPRRDDAACPNRGFYTYDAFVAAAGAFPSFGATGDNSERKREVAAFLAQTSQKTSGGSYSSGYCQKEVKGASSSDYCVPSAQWPCSPGKTYHPRGPMQISYNYNYGPIGQGIGTDLLSNPELVATDPIIAFKTALWLWMTPQFEKQPSCHAVATGLWNRTASDGSPGRAFGYRLSMNILTGGLQGGRATVEGRVRLYKRYCDILGVSYGPNLQDMDYYSLAPFDGTINSSA